MVEHIYRQLEPVFSEVILSANDDQVVIPGLRQVKDRYGVSGPLGGVVSVLEESSREINFVIACDIPWVPTELIIRLLDEAENHDAVVPVDSRGRFEPLFAVYTKRLVPVLKRLLDNGEKRIRMVYDLVDTHRMVLPEGLFFRNLNTESEFHEYLAGTLGA
jgi:molybdopterin-guanine dinucleotide biosynthesis protein A